MKRYTQGGLLILYTPRKDYSEPQPPEKFPRQLEVVGLNSGRTGLGACRIMPFFPISSLNSKKLSSGY